jgi:hypothetical protein
MDLSIRFDRGSTYYTCKKIDEFMDIELAGWRNSRKYIALDVNE